LRNLDFGRVGQFALIVGILALGKPVLVPVALAFYLAFVLTPLSNGLERLGLPRALSVAGVVSAALTLLAVLGSVLIAQTADLARQMQGYSVEMSRKLASLRGGSLAVFGNLSEAFSRLGHSLDPELGRPDHAMSVRVVPGSVSVYRQLDENFGPIVRPLGLIAIVLVMTVFVLGHREDLRGRLIQLVGPQNVTITTRTLAEAVNRVSHFLLTQAYINTGFGAVLALGLYVIGVPYALLWGAIAGVLRFVPLLGALIATLLPTLVALVSFPDSRHMLLTLGLFLVVELLVANLLEPLVLGKRTGVSALALLISALFWTWLWGPLGLVLATPLTVCAAVIGRHVPELSFLAIALGDEPGLNAEINFYQRTLARAAKDAYRLAKRKANETSVPQALDELLIPALGLMVADQNVQAINQSVADRVVQDIAAVVARLAAAESAVTSSTAAAGAVMGIPAESTADALLLEMLRVTLVQTGVAMTCLEGASRAELLASASRAQPAALCIAALPPSGNANARFLCRGLRLAAPNALIVVLSPEAEGKRSREAAARLREAGANGVAYGVREAQRMLSEPTEASALKSA
jgi:predicted PurR-regulated permease PerM